MHISLGHVHILKWPFWISYFGSRQLKCTKNVSVLFELLHLNFYFDICFLKNAFWFALSAWYLISWKIIVHLLHRCPYHFKFIFILSDLCYPGSILILVSKMSDLMTFIPLCYRKAGAPEILSLFGVVGIKTRPRACSAVHHAMHGGGAGGQICFY